MTDQDKTNDYISLGDLTKIFSNIFRLTFQLIELFFRIILKRKIWPIIGLFIGISIGIIQKKAQINNEAYVSSMLVSNNKLYKNTYAAIVEQLDVLIKNKQFDKLAAVLNIPDPIAAKILKIEATNINNSLLNQDTSLLQKQFFKINVSMKENDFSNLDSSILSYINNIPYLLNIRTDSNIVSTKALELVSGIKSIDTVKIEALTQKSILNWAIMGLIVGICLAIVVEIRYKAMS